MVVSDADEQLVPEFLEILVFLEKSLLPEHVNFVVNFVNNLFKGLVVELHDSLCQKIKLINCITLSKK